MGESVAVAKSWSGGTGTPIRRAASSTTSGAGPARHPSRLKMPSAPRAARKAVARPISSTRMRLKDLARLDQPAGRSFGKVDEGVAAGPVDPRQAQDRERQTRASAA